MDYKQNFIDAFKTALSVTKYQPPKDSTSAITIKVVDKKIIKYAIAVISPLSIMEIWVKIIAIII